MTRVDPVIAAAAKCRAAMAECDSTIAAFDKAKSDKQRREIDALLGKQAPRQYRAFQTVTRTAPKTSKGRMAMIGMIEEYIRRGGGIDAGPIADDDLLVALRSIKRAA